MDIRVQTVQISDSLFQFSFQTVWMSECLTEIQTLENQNQIKVWSVDTFFVESKHVIFLDLTTELNEIKL